MVLGVLKQEFTWDIALMLSMLQFAVITNSAVFWDVYCCFYFIFDIFDDQSIAIIPNKRQVYFECLTVKGIV